MSGICVNVKITGSGRNMTSFDVTQKSVEKFRQIASFRTANARKKNPQRRVSLRHPSSSRRKAESKA